MTLVAGQLDNNPSGALLAAIHADARRFKVKFQELSLQESDPVKAILQKSAHHLVQKSLQVLDCKITLTHDERIQKIWQRVISEPQAEAFIDQLIHLTEKNGQTLPHRFRDTALTVFRDDVQGALPRNGIRLREYLELTKLFQDIEAGKTNFILEGTPEEKEAILGCMARTASTQLGRDLLRDIVRHPRNVRICAASSSGIAPWFENKGRLRVNLSFKPEVIIEKMPDGTHRSVLCESWLSLTHELIHIRHLLNGTYVSSRDKLIDPAFHSAEEQRGITGQYEGIEDDEQNENAHRLLDDKCPRPNHEPGIDPSWPLEQQIQQAVRMDLLDELRQILRNKREEFTFRLLHLRLIEAVEWEKTDAARLLYELYRVLPKPSEEDSFELLIAAGGLKNNEFFERVASEIGFSHLIDPVDGGNALHFAFHDPKKVAYLLQRGVDPNHKDRFGNRIADLVLQDQQMSSSEKVEVLRLLLRFGARDLQGLDAFLLYAIKAGDQRLLRDLLRKKLSPQVKDAQGNTPLFYAVEQGRLDLVRQLVEAGADFHAPNQKGNTPLSLAFERGDRAILEFYSQRPERQRDIVLPLPGTRKDPATVRLSSLSDQELRLALLSEIQGSCALLPRLLEECAARGLSLDFYDAAGHTPLQLASQRGSATILMMVLQAAQDAIAAAGS